MYNLRSEVDSGRCNFRQPHDIASLCIHNCLSDDRAAETKRRAYCVDAGEHVR